MKTKITQEAVDKLPKGGTLSDSEIIGLRARRTPAGLMVYDLRYYNAQGRRVPFALGKGDIKVAAVRQAALIKVGEIAKGTDVAAVRAETRKRTGALVEAVLDDYCDQHADTLKSGFETRRIFTVYVKPAIGKANIYDLTRDQCVEMLDKVAKQNGKTQSDAVLAQVRAAFNWRAKRDGKFNTPLVKGMARTKPSKRARKRILDEYEIRDLWLALDEVVEECLVPRCFGPFVRALLLSAQRLRMVSNLPRDEIQGRRWTVPAERNKRGLEHLVPVTEMLADLFKTNNGIYVFSSDGGETAFKGFSKAKKALDLKLTEIRARRGAKPMAHWVLHDLRRTARSLMSRGGITSEIGQRVLGQIKQGVDGVYDQYQYEKEKREALEVLAREVRKILRPALRAAA